MSESVKSNIINDKTRTVLIVIGFRKTCDNFNANIKYIKQI